MSAESGSRLTKVTVLDGYYASGDHECFCFDMLDGPEAYPPGFDDVDERIALQDANRVYPHSLLPEGHYGRWTITVEFEALPLVSPEQQEGKVTMHKWVRLRKSEPLRCEHCGVYYAAQWSVVCPGPAPPSPEQEQR